MIDLILNVLGWAFIVLVVLFLIVVTATVVGAICITIDEEKKKGEKQ